MSIPSLSIPGSNEAISPNHQRSTRTIHTGLGKSPYTGSISRLRDSHRLHYLTNGDTSRLPLSLPVAFPLFVPSFQQLSLHLRHRGLIAMDLYSESQWGVCPTQSASPGSVFFNNAIRPPLREGGIDASYPANLSAPKPPRPEMGPASAPSVSWNIKYVWRNWYLFLLLLLGDCSLFGRLPRNGCGGPRAVLRPFLRLLPIVGWPFVLCRSCMPRIPRCPLLSIRPVLWSPLTLRTSLPFRNHEN